MKRIAYKILKEVGKNGEISLDSALRLNRGKTNSHIDQYPLVLLLEAGYLGITINTKYPEGMENMRALNEAINLHIYTLSKNERGEREYMGMHSHGSIEPKEERVFIKAKGALYLDEQRKKFWERIYSFIIAIIVGIAVAGFSAWIRGQTNAS